MQRLKHMLFVLVAPKRFIRASTDRIVELRKRTHQGPFTEEHRSDSERFARTQAAVLRRALFTGIAITSSTILIAALVGWGLRSLLTPSKVWVYLLQGFGAAVILGATLSQFGHRHESIGGETLADEMNTYIFRALYVVGTFVFVVSVSWDAT